jgi:hypothetical protein
MEDDNEFQIEARVSDREDEVEPENETESQEYDRVDDEEEKF